MSGRLVFVIIDGLNARTAEAEMGYMSALAGSGQAAYCRMRCELPPLSRPLYNCLFTGEPPLVSGVLSNDVWRPGQSPTIFALARAKGLITAASAYCWVSELCNRAPYEPLRDRFTCDHGLPISHGVFYDNDAYPDDSVFTDAEILRLRHNPHILLAHSMGVDYAGHAYGGDSSQYREAARRADMLLAVFAPRWLAAGHHLIVASDHGMDADKSHNGAKDEVREVPLWLAGEKFAGKSGKAEQKDVFRLACAAVGIVAKNHLIGGRRPRAASI